jgi:hypothetical protein
MLLEFIGCTVPDLENSQWDKNDGLPNSYRAFPLRLGGSQVAAFALETLISVNGLEESDYFDFTSRAASQILADLGTPERVKIHSGNPSGSLFGLIRPEDTGSWFPLPKPVGFLI